MQFSGKFPTSLEAKILKSSFVPVVDEILPPRLVGMVRAEAAQGLEVVGNCTEQ